MQRENNILNTALSQSIAEVEEARNIYNRAKIVHASSHRDSSQQCRRLARLEEVSRKCAAAVKTCRARQDNLSELIAKRNRLRAELDALRSSGTRMSQLNELLASTEDPAWEGGYRGVGRFSGYRIDAFDEGNSFRLTANKIGDAEAGLGISASHAIGEIGKAFRFCLQPDDERTCGAARLTASGFEFDGIEFERE